MIGDVCLWLFLYWGTVDWTLADRRVAFSLLGGVMLFSKFIKLVTHFVRYPVDILLWPASVMFGWFHGIVKMHAMLTVTEVCVRVCFFNTTTNIITDHLGIPSRCRLFRFGENGQAAVQVYWTSTILRREGISRKDASHSRLYEQISDRDGSLSSTHARRLQKLSSNTAGKLTPVGFSCILSISSSSLHHDCSVMQKQQRELL